MVAVLMLKGPLRPITRHSSNCPFRASGFSKGGIKECGVLQMQRKVRISISSMKKVHSCNCFLRKRFHVALHSIKNKFSLNNKRYIEIRGLGSSPVYRAHLDIKLHPRPFHQRLGSFVYYLGPKQNKHHANNKPGPLTGTP
jgi:hypothetical protein